MKKSFSVLGVSLAFEAAVAPPVDLDTPFFPKITKTADGMEVHLNGWFVLSVIGVIVLLNWIF